MENLDWIRRHDMSDEKSERNYELKVFGIPIHSVLKLVDENTATRTMKIKLLLSLPTFVYCQF